MIVYDHDHRYHKVTEHIEQLTDTMIEFEAFIKGSGGVAVPFALSITSPMNDGNDDYYCLIDCPYIRSDQFKIRGYDEKQAVELSLRFVLKWLNDDGVTLVDELGNPIEFPEYANERL